LNILRNSDKHVDKKTSCAISNFIQKRNPGKKTSAKAIPITQRFDGPPIKELTLSGSQNNHCKKKKEIGIQIHYVYTKQTNNFGRQVNFRLTLHFFKVPWCFASVQ
jgi:hypothetical protein